MRHNSRMNAAAELMGQRRTAAERASDRITTEVSRMGDDELCEIVGKNPASDSPYAEEYFIAAAREIVRRVDERQIVGV
jgi:hypothetical protein